MRIIANMLRLRHVLHVMKHVPEILKKLRRGCISRGGRWSSQRGKVTTLRKLVIAHVAQWCATATGWGNVQYRKTKTRQYDRHRGLEREISLSGAREGPV